ncbi:MAG: recombinase zinc beta ribbon domain-containing protein [Ruminococcus sp.]|nr:recombinase zinc beta ribbon domain-containing protein [Ruminococcus sp.]
MVCSDCGALMVGESGTSRKGTVYNYYKCANVKKRLGCHRPSLRKDLAEKLVFQKVMEEMFTEDMIEMIADKVMEVQKQENSASCFKSSLRSLKRVL